MCVCMSVCVPGEWVGNVAALTFYAQGERVSESGLHEQCEPTAKSPLTCLTSSLTL